MQSIFTNSTRPPAHGPHSFWYLYQTWKVITWLTILPTHPTVIRFWVGNGFSWRFASAAVGYFTISRFYPSKDSHCIRSQISFDPFSLYWICCPVCQACPRESLVSLSFWSNHTQKGLNFYQQAQLPGVRRDRDFKSCNPCTLDISCRVPPSLSGVSGAGRPIEGWRSQKNILTTRQFWRPWISNCRSNFTISQGKFHSSRRGWIFEYL